MNYSFGLIGAGNMGGAIALAVSRSISDGALVDRDQSRAQALADGGNYFSVLKINDLTNKENSLFLFCSYIWNILLYNLST